MAHAAESLERAEHVGHSGHGHGGHGDDKDPLPTRIGITMATLGVLLAFAGARTGFERAELVQYLVDQQHAHAKYNAQDIKHRTAVLSLQQLHALPDSKPIPADMVAIAKSVNRYLAETEAAKTWVETYDPIIEAHAEAQEEYEHAQLAAELGVVIASIALLLRKRIVWYLALALGALSIILLGITYNHTSHAVHGADEKIEHAEKAYRKLREEGKTTEDDQTLVDEVLKNNGTAAH